MKPNDLLFGLGGALVASTFVGEKPADMSEQDAEVAKRSLRTMGAAMLLLSLGISLQKRIR